MELEYIDWLREQLRSPHALALRDDAGVLRAPDSVVTTDMLMDGVHFESGVTDLRRIGRKSLGASLSDLAAMAAQPDGALLSLALPRDNARQTGEQVTSGLLELARTFHVELIGGDTNVWNGPLVVSVTAWGTPIHGMLTRSGGQPGDALIVTGSLGGSLLGHHLDFTPRVTEALQLQSEWELHAGMDITDGLVVDLSRLAAASQCGAVLNPDAIPISSAAHEASRQDGRSPLDHALHDGEDFELLLAMAEETWNALAESQSEASAGSILPVRMTRVGHLCETAGLFTEQPDGRLQPLEVKGFIHGGDHES